LRRNTLLQKKEENTVIDYVLGDEEVREKVRRMKIGEKMDLNHQPGDVVFNWTRFN